MNDHVDLTLGNESRRSDAWIRVRVRENQELRRDFGCHVGDSGWQFGSGDAMFLGGRREEEQEEQKERLNYSALCFQIMIDTLQKLKPRVLS
jgi:hypothetical protein